MRKTWVLLAILVVATLFIFGCARGGSGYNTGYAAYNQPTQQGGGQQQGYVGGGCAVAGPDSGNVDVSEPSAAA
tara:strand:+ start:12190 stop:12411 length:222 start_codon:yes stop_codon:yes gene_type:complete